MKKKTGIIIISIIAVISLVFYLKGGVTINTITKADKIASEPNKPFITSIERQVIVTGSIAPRKEIDIKPSIPGIVESVNVIIGQKVKKGEQLAKLLVVPNLEDLSSVESDLRIDTINKEDAYRELGRQKKLFDAGAIAETDLIKATKDYKISEQNLKSAEDKLQVIKEGAAKESSQASNSIVATCDGVILTIPVKEGSSVMGRSAYNEGTTLFTIADMNQLVFNGKIEEADVADLKEGMRIELTIGAIEKEKFEGVIEMIAPEGTLDQGSIKFDFRASVIPKEGKILRAGYSANAHIILEKKENVLAIKEGDIDFSNDSAFVQVKEKNGMYRKQYITTGISDGINIEVVAGLNKDEEIKSMSGTPSGAIIISNN